MEVAELREQYMELMLNLVKDSDYPSSTILQQVEQSIVTPQDAAAYAEILVEKVQGKFPSHALLERIGRVITALEEAQARQAA